MARYSIVRIPEKKVSSMSQDELTRYIEENSTIDGSDLNKMLAR